MSPARRHLITGLVAAGLLAGTATSASALVHFKSPSGNIGCIGDRTEVRCDIRQSSATPPPRPKTCRFDWGTAYVITPKAKRGRGLCASDTTLPTPGDRSIRAIAYGTSIRFGPLKCTSRRTGMTCRNRLGHGFRLSRQVIRLF